MTQPWGRESVPLPRLREILGWHRGAKQAITARDLAMMLGLHERDGRSIREAVNRLLTDGFPVGSTTRNGGGYFRVETDAELQACVADYQSRAREDLRKADLLIRAFRQGERQPSLLTHAP